MKREKDPALWSGRLINPIVWMCRCLIGSAVSADHCVTHLERVQQERQAYAGVQSKHAYVAGVAQMYGVYVAGVGQRPTAPNSSPFLF